LKLGYYVDWSSEFQLLEDKLTPFGTMTGTFQVPPGLEGQSFMLLASAVNAKGDVGKSTLVQVDVSKGPAISAKPVDAIK
jgi:hypothetical protein